MVVWTILKCSFGYLNCALSLDNARSKTTSNFRQSCIHVVPLPIFFLVLGWWRRLFLLYQIFPVQGTCSVQLQPGCYAFQIEHVVSVAWETHDERILICNPVLAKKAVNGVAVDIPSKKGLPQIGQSIDGFRSLFGTRSSSAGVARVSRGTVERYF